MMATDPMTPPDVLAARTSKGRKPDAQGRLIFRPFGLFGSAYVIETAEQLARVERFERNKIIGAGWVGAVVVGLTLSLSDDASLFQAYATLVIVVAVVGGTLGYALANGRRIVKQTAMRPRP